MSDDIADDALGLINKYRSSIMGFAALWIFVFHIWIPIFSGIPGVGSAEIYIKRIGFCGVDIFFLLSGMGLTYAINKTPLLIFWKNRFMRVIFPFLIIGIAESIYFNRSFGDFIRNITGYNFYAVNIYSFLWFVPGIFTFYLFFPLYYFFFAKSDNKLGFTIGSIALWLVITLWSGKTVRTDMFGFTNRIPVFLLGIYWGDRSQKGKLKFDLHCWFGLFFVLIAGLWLSYETNFQGMYLLVPVSNCCMPNFLIASSLVLLLAKGYELLNQGKYTQMVGKAVVCFFSFFGKISLELYCVQELWNGFLRTLLPNMGVRKMNVLMLISTTLIALLLHYANRLLGKAFNWHKKAN